MYENLILKIALTLSYLFLSPILFLLVCSGIPACKLNNEVFI